MATSKLATRSAFQIFFKRARFPFRSERNGGFDSPWPVLRSMWTFALIVFEQGPFEITRNSGVVDRLVRLTDQNVNVVESLHLLACQAVVFGPPAEKIKTEARLRFAPAWQPSLFRCVPKRRLAEGVRFELTRPFGLPVFKTGAINRSATPPGKATIARSVPPLENRASGL